MGRSLNKVKAPDVVWMFRPEPDAGPVIEPKTRSFRLLLRYSQPLMAPDALNPVLAYRHATVVEYGRHPTVTVAAVVRCNQDNVPGQFFLIGLQCANVSLRSTWLPDNPAGSALAQVITALRCINSLPASLGAYKFPSAMSFRTCFSSDRSSISFFSWPFSCSSSFSFRACSTFRPPHSFRYR